jgi:hypothetical protein
MTDKKPTLARIAWTLLKLAAMRSRLIVGCWLAGTTPAAVQREFRLRALNGTLPPGVVVAPRGPARDEFEAREATVMAIVHSLLRRERARWRLRWEEFRLRLVEAKVRRRRRGEPPPAP